MNHDALHQQFERFWSQLRAPGDADRIATIDLPQPTGNGPLLLGKSQAGRSLLIPMAKDQHRTFREDRRSAAVQLVRRPLSMEGGDRWFAEILCRRGELDSVFTAFCSDVVLRIAADASSDPAAVGATTLKRWRSLFSTTGRRLGMQQLRGLFAELLVLRRLLSRPGGDVLTWTGPLRRPHDFELGPWAIEVKAGGLGETRMRIHGVKQLEPPKDGRLALVHFQVAEADDGLTVPELVAALRGQAGPKPLMLRLELAGYQTLDEEHYQAPRLRVEQETWFAVDAHFPRVVESSFAGDRVPVGVDELHYDVDISERTPTVLSDADVERFFEGLRGARV